VIVARRRRRGAGRLQDFYPNEGHVRQRTPEQQTEQALCLSIVCNAIVAWNTVYIQRVLDELLAAGELVTTSEIERISPLAHQHTHRYGHYPFDLATRPDGHWPLRPPATPWLQRRDRYRRAAFDVRRWPTPSRTRLIGASCEAHWSLKCCTSTSSIAGNVRRACAP
jgi:hypothetical protein